MEYDERQTTALAERATSHEVFALPDLTSLKAQLDEVRKFQAIVRQLLIPGHDYGTIPGTDKPTLLKPGAEKIDKILHLADTYEEMECVEDWTKPFFHYKVKCRLLLIGTDIVISEGIGSCNSMESRYRYRWVYQSKLPSNYQGDANKEARSTLVTKKIKTQQGWATLYHLENDDIFSLANTILKMGKKRAHIDASLSAGRLSDVFTQDIEDILDYEPAPEPQRPAQQQAQPKAEPKEEQTASPPDQEEATDTHLVDAALEMGAEILPGTDSEPETEGEPETEPGQMPTGKNVQNVTELKKLMMKHKIGTKEAYEVLEITSFQQLGDLDAAWAKIKQAKGVD